jgi:hypothetical protein
MFCAQYPSDFQFAQHAFTKLAVCPSAASSPSSCAKVPHALALLAVRPSAASVRFCAVASHSTGTPRSRLRRHRLAFGTVSATVDATFSSVQQTFRQANGLEHPVQRAAEFLGFSWRSNRPLPNRSFKRDVHASHGRPLTFALGRIY